MLLWKYPATLLGGSTTPNLEMQNFLDGFVKHRELTLNDVPIMMTYLDDTPSGKLCVMYQKQSNIEAIDEHTTESQKLYNFDSSKVKISP
jgi:high-affinity K+ transport system ATPase subunit B